MITTDYAMLMDACKKRGLAIDRMQILEHVVSKSIIYKYKTEKATRWLYEIHLPGRGASPLKKSWTQIKIIH